MDCSYALTSYGAQGKTVDHVIICDSQSRAATHQKEFYVSISRARESISIITSDVEGLKGHIAQSGERELATDLILHKPEHYANSDGDVVSRTFGAEVLSLPALAMELEQEAEMEMT